MRARSSIQKGIGLLETLIYVAITVLLMVIVVNTAGVVSVVSGKARLKRNILGEAGIAAERMVREIRLADSVLLTESTLGAHPGTLALSSVVGADDDTPITRTFYLSGDTLMMKEGEGAAVPLTDKVSVTKLIFYRVVASTTSEAVTFELTAEDALKSLTESHTFNATSVLRRSY